jgi:carbonic anhydrase
MPPLISQMHLNDDGALSAIAYGVGTLGARHGMYFFKVYAAPTQLTLASSFYAVVVVGHSKCGGAAASLAAARDTPHITESTDPSVGRWLADLTARVRTLGLSNLPTSEALPIVVEENVRMQVANVCNTQTIIDAWSNFDPEKRKVWVHGWIYDLASGRLRDLRISRGPTESTCVCRL